MLLRAGTVLERRVGSLPMVGRSAGLDAPGGGQIAGRRLHYLRFGNNV